MKTVKKAVAMMISIIVAFVSIPVVSAATSGDFKYSVLSDGTAEISGYYGTAKTVAIPDTIDGYSVVSIGDYAFEDCNSLTSVTIPNGVTSIGCRAFYDCSSLTSVTIPNGVISIGDYAFCGCSSLTSVTIPNSVTSIGSSAFCGCSNLTSVAIPSIVTSIGRDAFVYCSSLTAISVSDKNPEYSSLDGVLFDKDKTTIIAYPAGKIGSYDIPSGVTSINYDAFWGCSNLTSVTIPDSVTFIGSYAFRDCSSLTSVTIPSSVTSIVFGTFWECDRLTSVTIPNSIKSIGGHAFWGCSNLTSVTFPDSVTSIGYNAFYGCNNLTSVTIPSSVTEIQYGAFGNCSSLTSVTIPSSVTTIGALVFSHCSNLTSVMIPSSVTSMGSGVFSYCSSLVSISVSDENPNYSSLDGVLFDKEKTEIIAYPAAKACSYDIPSSVTSIGWNAFEGCSSLISVTIPRGVTIIGAYAFSYCSSLAAVTIPSSVTSIGKDAFSYCSSLTSVTIPDSVTSIGPSAFFTSNDITIYGFQGSAAQEYAAEYNILFVELNRLVDTENRISVAETVPGSIPENAQLKIEYLKNTQDEIIYDITLEKDGKPIQPTDGMTVSIPVPQTMNAETCKVFYIDGSGNLTDMNAVYEDGYMTFTTTHFSHYALVQGIDGMLGDLSGNGSLDVDDSLCLFRYVSGQQDLTIKQKVLADVKHDGVLTLSDALLLYRAVSGRATL